MQNAMTWLIIGKFLDKINRLHAILERLARGRVWRSWRQRGVRVAKGGGFRKNLLHAIPRGRFRAVKTLGETRQGERADT